MIKQNIILFLFNSPRGMYSIPRGMLLGMILVVLPAVLGAVWIGRFWNVCSPGKNTRVTPYLPAYYRLYRSLSLLLHRADVGAGVDQRGDAFYEAPHRFNYSYWFCKVLVLFLVFVLTRLMIHSEFVTNYNWQLIIMLVLVNDYNLYHS